MSGMIFVGIGLLEQYEGGLFIMSLINISHLTFSYDGSYDDIFTDVSFQIDTDWKLGFVGRNGRGKTTFLKLLMGEFEYRGNISASVEFSYFPFEVEDVEERTLDILDSISNNHMFWQLQREMALLEIDEKVLYRPFSTLSNGERTKALLAALFLRENNFLLIDEPTNHLDMHGRSVVGKYLSGKKGFILVSHDRAFLDASVDHILSINKANIEVRKGDFSAWYRDKENIDRFELAKNEKLKGEIKHLEEATKRTADWSDKVEAGKLSAGDRGYAGKQAKLMMQRAKSIETRRNRAVEEKSKLLKNIERNENLAIRPLKHRKQRLIEVKELSLRYGERTVVANMSFCVEQGERIALTGKNGCGKTSVLRLLAGFYGSDHGVQRTASPMDTFGYSGTIWIPNDLIISYMPQDTSFLEGDLIEYARRECIDESLFLTILRKLDFPRVQFEKDMRDFSQGQRKKALIAKSLCEQAHVYIWDEPLNYIDVLSRIQIETLLGESAPTMLLVEHDVSFIKRVCTEAVHLHK